MEGAIAIPLEQRADRDAPALPAHHWHGLGRRPPHSGRAPARTSSMVLGARGDHRSGACPAGSSRKGPSHGASVDRLGQTTRSRSFMTLPQRDFPRLTAVNHRITNPATAEYNCVAWAAEDTEHWWQPGIFWLPKDWPADD